MDSVVIITYLDETFMVSLLVIKICHRKKFCTYVINNNFTMFDTILNEIFLLEE